MTKWHRTINIHCTNANFLVFILYIKCNHRGKDVEGPL